VRGDAKRELSVGGAPVGSAHSGQKRAVDGSGPPQRRHEGDSDAPQSAQNFAGGWLSA